MIGPLDNYFRHRGGISPADEGYHNNFLDQPGLNVPFILIDPDKIEIRTEDKETLPEIELCGYK